MRCVDIIQVSNSPKIVPRVRVSQVFLCVSQSLLHLATSITTAQVSKGKSELLLFYQDDCQRMTLYYETGGVVRCLKTFGAVVDIHNELPAARYIRSFMHY